jgi:D-alanine-D-alanine ligase-like ATP-grasp enzyme
MDALIEQFATAYDDAEAFKRQCRSDKNWMAEIEVAVIERKVAEQVHSLISVKDKKVSYQEAMDYKAKQENHEEA